MRNIAITIALLALVLTLSACAGVRAEVGAIPTDAPPPQAPTPYVIMVREPAPAQADESTTFTRAILAAAAVFVCIVSAGVVGAVAAQAFNALREPAPERSQLNERPTYEPPHVTNPLYLPDEWEQWSTYKKSEWLEARGCTGADARRIIDASTALKLPPARR